MYCGCAALAPSLERPLYVETELPDLRPVWPLILLQRVRDFTLPLPCNGRALPTIAQWMDASGRPCLHRIFVHPAAPELGVQRREDYR